MYSSFRKKFKKKFNTKSDDHIDVYLGSGFKSWSRQEHYLMACLEKFGLFSTDSTASPRDYWLSISRALQWDDW